MYNNLLWLYYNVLTEDTFQLDISIGHFNCVILNIRFKCVLYKMIDVPSNSTMCVIFSKDRPLQLLATLESILKYVDNISVNDIFILYKASNSRFQHSYDSLSSIYKCHYVRETKNMFRKCLTSILNNPKYTLVLFCTDDTIFFQQVSLNQISRALKTHTRSIGFSLRLGENTKYCYMKDTCQTYGDSKRSPNILNITMIWEWKHSTHDFNYPLELSSSIYRRLFALHLVRNLSYTNPNNLEHMMDSIKHSFTHEFPHLMSYTTSRAVSIPVNITQTTYSNRHANDSTLSTKNLLRIFEKGKKIDIHCVKKTIIDSPHIEIFYEYINRP